MWNPIDSQVRQWAAQRSRVLRHHLTPEGLAIAELRAAHVAEHTINALYPSTRATWKPGAYALIEQATSKPFLDFDFERPVQQSIFLRLRSDYAAAREIAVVLDDKAARPDLREAWWAVGANKQDSPTLLQDSLALCGLVTHLMTEHGLAPSPKMNAEGRWDLNFPSYHLLVDHLCEMLVGSGWMCPSPTRD